MRGDARAWRIVKVDDAVNAVVLRAAGDRAFCAGLDVKTSYGQPDDVWNHEDPGELLSPKWQKVWKPVVCAVQGMCTAGAFYFVNEADVVICSDDATFFDSHVTAGLVSALEPIGLMRRIGLGETLRIALMGNDERVTAETALRIGLVTEVVPRDRALGARPRDRGDDRRQAAAATQGTVRAIWESLDKPYRAAHGAGPDLHAARQPDRAWPSSPTQGAPAKSEPTDPVMTDHPLRQRIAAVLALDPGRAARSSSTAQWFSWATARQRLAAPDRRAGRRPRARSGSCCATGPPMSPRCSACCWPAACVVVINPSRGDDRTRADIAALDLPVIIGDARRSGDAGRAGRPASTADRDRRPRRRAAGDAGRRRRCCRPAPASRCGC